MGDDFDNLVEWFDAVSTIWGIVSITAPYGYRLVSERIVEAMMSANIMSDITNVIGDTITDYFKGGDK